jgi:phosphatidylglycerol:prolipoprotein diacylglycerol transferase
MMPSDMPTELYELLKSTLPLSWAGLWYALGYGVGVLAFVLMALRRKFPVEPVINIAIVGLVGGMVGANITQIAFGGTPGKTVLGGVAVGYLCVALYKHYAQIRRPTGDLFAVALMAGEAVGRWGCYFGGCCYGKPTDLPWAVFQHEALRHPTQAYLSIATFLILTVLLWYEFRRPLPENGLFYLQGVLYCVARFSIEFYRDGASHHAGLTTAQWVCIGGVMYFVVRGFSLRRNASVVRSEVKGQNSEP